LVSQFNQLKIRRREPPELDVQKEVPVLLQELVAKHKTRQKMSVQQMVAFFNLTELEYKEVYI
jgi:hypothetical protein